MASQGASDVTLADSAPTLAQRGKLELRPYQEDAIADLRPPCAAGGAM